MRSLHRCTSPPSYSSMFKRCSHKFLLPCPSRILLELPPMYDLCQSVSAPPLVKQHLFTSWRILSSNPILLNQGNKDYSSSSTSAIKILVSARLHCRRCYGATYHISSSENGNCYISENRNSNTLTGKATTKLPALIFCPREKIRS